jgi:hypothetical protein
VIVAGGGERTVVGREGHATDKTGMPAKSADRPSRARLPGLYATPTT